MDTAVIARPRITRKLQSMLTHPLSIIHAPMGYGKTTAVEQALDGVEADVLWVPLAAAGSTADDLWQRLTGQLRRLRHPLAERLSRLQTPYDPLQSGKLRDILIDFEYTRPLVIVVDDFQMMADPRPFTLFRQIAQERIEAVHIVLITRELSQISAVGLYQKQLCFTLTDKALRFTEEETDEYFRQMGCPLDEDQLERVMAYADGWASMLFVYCKSLQRGVPIGRSRTVDDIIEQNLLSGVEACQRSALVALSLLESFNLPMASYVLDSLLTPDALSAFVHRTTFFVFDEVGDRYQIRGVIKAYFVERAMCRREEADAVYRRAGEWCLGEGRYSAGFEYLYRAGEVESILAALNRESTPDIHFLQFPQIHRIFQGLSETLCLRYPIAYLQYIRIYAMSEDPMALSRCREYLQNMESFVRSSDDDERHKRFLLGEINVIWTFVAFNDLPEMVRRNLKAVEYFGGGCSCIVTRRKEFTFGSPELLYLYHTRTGGLRDTTDFFIQNAGALIGSVSGCGMGSESLIRAEYALETGDFEQVELHAYKALYKAKLKNQVCVMLCAQFALDRLAALRGERPDGAMPMESLRKEVLAENNPVLNTTFELCVAYLNLCMFKPEGVASWIMDGDAAGGSFLRQARSFFDVVQLKAAIATGDYILLEALADTMRQGLEAYRHQLGYLHCLIGGAIAKNHLLGPEAALPALEQAVSFGEQDHLVLPFAEAGRELAPLLNALCERNDSPYLRELCVWCGQYLGKVERLRESAVLLTPREREIMRLLEQGLKHEEIGGKLYISVTTVRYHIKNIYQKLEVNNKTLALRKAHELRLLK